MSDIIKEAREALGGVVLAIDEDGDAYALPSGAYGNLVALPARNDDYAIQHTEIWGAMVARFNAHPALIARAEAAEAALARAYMAGRDDAAGWCDENTMYIPMDHSKRVYSGLYCAGENVGGKHQGMGYAEAILAISVPADLAKRLGVSHE